MSSKQFTIHIPFPKFIGRAIYRYLVKHGKPTTYTFRKDF